MDEPKWLRWCTLHITATFSLLLLLYLSPTHRWPQLRIPASSFVTFKLCTLFKSNAKLILRNRWTRSGQGIRMSSIDGAEGAVLKQGRRTELIHWAITALARIFSWSRGAVRISRRSSLCNFYFTSHILWSSSSSSLQYRRADASNEAVFFVASGDNYFGLVIVPIYPTHTLLPAEGGDKEWRTS